MKFSQVSPNSTPALVDYLMGVTSGNVDFRVTIQNLLTLLLKSTQLSNPSKFAVYRNAAQSITGGTFAKINFDAKDYDTGSDYDAVTNFRFTARTSGFYQFDYLVGAPVSSGSTDTVAAIYKNGTIYAWGQELPVGGNMIGNKSIQLTAGDYIEIFAANVGTVALNVGGSPRKTYFEGVLISAS